MAAPGTHALIPYGLTVGTWVRECNDQGLGRIIEVDDDDTQFPYRVEYWEDGYLCWWWPARNSITVTSPTADEETTWLLHRLSE